jgi:hypothetical protein
MLWAQNGLLIDSVFSKKLDYIKVAIDTRTRANSVSNLGSRRQGIGSKTNNIAAVWLYVNLQLIYESTYVVANLSMVYLFLFMNVCTSLQPPCMC